ncbi:hypothetical protein EV683_12536 [Crenobacter luteus]|uniref:Uncharacterized protein n=1 Tax=Crenobacter luteus TaxID=1452487 RepID=A0A161TM66_9NEIS|nr:hypothetical protein [Crenobacter luteus]KZE26856.1 hypothetical protein AVW16_13920 [Crenobacter luteus]TCP10303.1 hypothetical protein EV683_12536 [Crenobacter luteus]
MPRLTIRLVKPQYTPVDAREFEINFRRALIEHFGSEDSTTFAKWAHDYALEQLRGYPTGIDEADQLIDAWREAEARAHCLAFEEWMRCVPEPVFEVGLEH